MGSDHVFNWAYIPFIRDSNDAEGSLVICSAAIELYGKRSMSQAVNDAAANNKVNIFFIVVSTD